MIGHFSFIVSIPLSCVNPVFFPQIKAKQITCVIATSIWKSMHPISKIKFSVCFYCYNCFSKMIFLSGTVQDADEFDSQYAEIASAETGDETGMVSIDGMEDYFQKQFGEIMTADCIADLLADRSMIAPMKLAQKLDKDIIAQDIQLTAKSGEDNAYDFSTQLVTSDDKQPVGTATGYVKMQSDNSTWKASALTIKITTN